MRIEAYNQVAQIYHSTKVDKTQTTKGAASSRDELSISSSGYSYQVAKKAVAETADIREDKVAALKQKILAGDYQVAEEDFATKLIEKYNTL